LEDSLLRPLLQVGISLTLRIQQHALQVEKMLRQHIGESWVTLLDSPFRETYNGVRRQPPMFFRGLETPGEIFFRRFQELAEIEHVETLLAHIPLWFTACLRWHLLPEQQEHKPPTALSLALLWNTAFARWVMSGKPSTKPLTRAELTAFQERLSPDALSAERERFLAVVSKELSLKPEEIAALQALASFAQDKLEEVLAIDATSTDLRFVEGILVQS
jgi:hypothetical protein